MSKKHFSWVAASLVIIIGALLIPIKDDGIAAQAVHPFRGDISRTVSAFGRIRPVKEVKISPDVSGEIVEICFEEGDRVHKGDLLLKIRQDSYLLAITRCEAALESAVKARDAQNCELKLKEMEYNRLKQLCKSDAAPAAQKDQAELELESARAHAGECECQIAAAQASLDAARSELEKTLIYAPIEGTITSLAVKPGERVVGTATMPGTEILTIADLSKMELVVQIGENDIGSIKIGDSATIKADAAAASPLEGHVTRIAVSASAAGMAGVSTDFEVRIGIDSKGVSHLRPGMSASVVIDTGSKNDILTVPLQAVVISDGRETVWTVDKQRRVHSRPVDCGIQDFGRIEITDGLSEEDLIVSGPYKLVTKDLREGDKIKVKDEHR